MKLYQHQKVALNYLRFNQSFLLNMEQGTGKTLPTLCRLLELFEHKEIKSALVVCPKSVIGSWYRDIEKFTEEQQQVLSNITIINYDKVWRSKDLPKQFDCIVLDEAHSIKNRTSRRASFLLNLSVGAKYRYLLTGTPISNGRLEDLFSLITFMNPYRIGSRIYSAIFKELDGGKGSYTEFLARYCYLDQFHKPYKYRNVNRLQDVLNEYSFRVKKEECLDLPEKLPDEILELELPQKKLYKDIAKNSASLEYDFVASNPLVKLTKLRQIASGFFINENGETFEQSCEKLSVLEEFLRNFDKKLVIFAEFKCSILQISELLTRLNVKYVVLNGEQTNKLIWRDFQNDPTIKVIVCQYASACQGIDLFASDTILYYEPTLRSNQLEQSRDRIHRNGQKQKCSYIHFITKGTVEVAIYKALKGFTDFNEKLFTQYIEEYQKAVRK